MKHYKAAGPVSLKHRRLAATFDHDTDAIHQLGKKQALKTSWDACQATVAAYRDGKPNLSKTLATGLWRGLGVLSQGMLLSWLRGYVRAHDTAKIQVPKDSLALSAYRDAVWFLQHRLDLSPQKMKKMQRKFDTNAMYMYGKVKGQAEKKLEEAMVDITKEGMHVKEGVMRLHEAFQSAGIMPDNSYTLENLYRTNTALAYSAGRRWADQQGAIQDILWGYVYTTVGDDRVRPAHQALEGVTLPASNEFWDTHTPPLGWSCVPPETLITTTRGDIPITSVVVGDKVLTHKNRFRSVLVVHCNPGPSKLYTLHLNNGGKLSLTGNHRVFTQRGWVQASVLDISDYLLDKMGATFFEVPRQNINDTPKVEGFTDCAVPVFTGSGVSLDFNSNSEINKQEVQPVFIGGYVKSVRNFFLLQNIRKLLFSIAHLCRVVSVAGRIDKTQSRAGCDRFADNFRVVERRSLLKRSRNVLVPLRVQIVRDFTGLFSAIYNYFVVPENAQNASVLHPGYPHYFLQSSFLVLVGSQEIGKSARPRLVDAKLGFAAVGFRSARLDSHSNVSKKGNVFSHSIPDGVADVKWKKIQGIETTSYEGDVWNLGVEDDKSYFAEGVAVHNCRCVTIPIFDDDWEEIEPPDDIDDELDDGFLFDKGELFGDVIDPDDMDDEPSDDWKEEAEEAQIPVDPTDADIVELVSGMSDAEREIVCEELGISEEDLEDMEDQESSLSLHRISTLFDDSFLLY